MTSAFDDDRKDAYEQADARVRPLYGAGLLLTALILASFLIGSWLISAFGSRAAAVDEAEDHLLDAYRPRPQEAVLQSQPAADMAAYRAEMQGQVEAYSWIDQDNGVVQVPVERAMELLLERGLEARAGSDGR